MTISDKRSPRAIDTKVQQSCFHSPIVSSFIVFTESEVIYMCIAVLENLLLVFLSPSLNSPWHSGDPLNNNSSRNGDTPQS